MTSKKSNLEPTLIMLWLFFFSITLAQPRHTELPPPIIPSHRSGKLLPHITLPLPRPCRGTERAGQPSSTSSWLLIQWTRCSPPLHSTELAIPHHCSSPLSRAPCYSSPSPSILTQRQLSLVDLQRPAISSRFLRRCASLDPPPPSPSSALSPPCLCRALPSSCCASMADGSSRQRKLCAPVRGLSLSPSGILSFAAGRCRRVLRTCSPETTTLPSMPSRSLETTNSPRRSRRICARLRRVNLRGRGGFFLTPKILGDCIRSCWR